MADVTVVAANVGIRGIATVSVGTAGEALTQGEAVYQKASDGEIYLADADNTAATASAVGVVLTPAADGQNVVFATGPVDLGATLVVGTVYVVSDTAGGIKPIADLTTGDYVTELGIATAANALNVSINATGVLTP